MTSTCFNCSQPATTDDHVPPKAFFPEEKDLDAGQNLRKNLITVPACKQCNNSASMADEYVAYMIATSHASNRVAMNHVASKVLRALKRSEGFRRKFLDSKAPVTLNGQETVALQFDFSTFNAVMTRVARGLHYKRTSTRLTDDLLAISPYILNQEYPFDLWSQVQWAADRLPWLEGPGCDNPDVFRYRYLECDPVFAFLFYGGFTVLVNRVLR